MSTVKLREAPARLGPRKAAAGRISAVARRHAFVMLRSPHRLFDVTIWPLNDRLDYQTALGASIVGTPS